MLLHAASASWAPQLQLAVPQIMATRPPSSNVICSADARLDRRAVLFGAAAAAAVPLAASAQIESSNPANNYYFVRARQCTRRHT